MAKTKGYAKIRDRYYARISVRGKRVNLGAFDTEEEARTAYEYACEQLDRNPDRPPTGRPTSKSDDLTPLLYSKGEVEKLMETVEFLRSNLMESVGPQGRKNRVALKDHGKKLEWLNRQLTNLVERLDHQGKMLSNGLEQAHSVSLENKRLTERLDHQWKVLSLVLEQLRSNKKLARRLEELEG